MGRNTFLCTELDGLHCSPHHCTWAYRASFWWREKFHAFLLLQRFLPGIQSHRSSFQKQVTSPQQPPGLGCLNFPERGLAELAQVHLGEQRCGQRGGSPGTLLVLVKSQDWGRLKIRTRVRSSRSRVHDKCTLGTRLRISPRQRLESSWLVVACHALSFIRLVSSAPVLIQNHCSVPAEQHSGYLDFPGVLLPCQSVPERIGSEVGLLQSGFTCEFVLLKKLEKRLFTSSRSERQFMVMLCLCWWDSGWRAKPSRAFYQFPCNQWAFNPPSLWAGKCLVGLMGFLDVAQSEYPC